MYLWIKPKMLFLLIIMFLTETKHRQNVILIFASSSFTVSAREVMTKTTKFASYHTNSIAYFLKRDFKFRAFSAQ